MSFCVVLIYREHVSRLLRQDRRHVRDTDVEWNGDAKDASVFRQWMPWFEGVLTSSTFQPSMTTPHSPTVVPELPRHVQQVIDESSVYYQQLYDVRLTPYA